MIWKSEGGLRAELFFRHRIEHLCDFGRGEALLAEGGEGEGIVSFCEAFAGVIADEFVMVEARFGKIEEGLENAVNVGGGEEVFATGD